MNRVKGFLVRTAVMFLAALAITAIWIGFRFYVPDLSRAVLEKKYSKPPTQYVEAAGVRLRVADAGPRNAPVLIMLHGFGSSLETWHYWELPLAKRYRIVRYDLPGFGLTGADPSGLYNDERDVAVLTALMDRLGVRRATIIGSSTGGEIAWKFAAERPDRVERLVLVSPDGFADKSVYGKKPQLPSMIGVLRFMSPDIMLRQAMNNAYAHSSRMRDTVYARTRDLMLAPGVRGAMIARLQQSILVDPAPILARIKAPTLVMWGDKDSIEPLANAPRFAEGIPHARLVLLPGLGHIPFREDPERSLAALRTFLDATETPTPGS